MLKTYAGELIDVSTLSDNELTQMQYSEEQAFAQAILAAEPFSEERSSILTQAYETIDAFVDEQNRRQGKKELAYGANSTTVKRLITLLNHRFPKGDVLFFEAGVGTGLIISEISKTDRFTVSGCDVYINSELKNKFPGLIEDNLYDSLDRFEDDSIACFYSNDVFEHLPPDEMKPLAEKIFRKIAPGGIVVTITPNRYLGPFDITRIADPDAVEAKGLHLHEYSYAEMNELLGNAGFRPYAWRFFYMFIFVCPKLITRFISFLETKNGKKRKVIQKITRVFHIEWTIMIKR